MDREEPSSGDSDSDDFSISSESDDLDALESEEAAKHLDVKTPLLPVGYEKLVGDGEPRKTLLASWEAVTRLFPRKCGQCGSGTKMKESVRMLGLILVKLYFVLVNWLRCECPDRMRKV